MMQRELNTVCGKCGKVSTCYVVGSAFYCEACIAKEPGLIGFDPAQALDDGFFKDGEVGMYLCNCHKGTGTTVGIGSFHETRQYQDSVHYLAVAVEAVKRRPSLEYASYEYVQFRTHGSVHMNTDFEKVRAIAFA